MNVWKGSVYDQNQILYVLLRNVGVLFLIVKFLEDLNEVIGIYRSVVIYLKSVFKDQNQFVEFKDYEKVDIRIFNIKFGDSDVVFIYGDNRFYVEKRRCL